MTRGRAGALVAAGVTLAAATPAGALDKQGSAHGGAVEGAESGQNLSGAVAWGVSLWNPTYAARPDNTGRALLRYALHLDGDLVGRRLSVPLDVSLFTDRQRAGLAKAAPTELDVITGLTSTWRLGPGALELGARVEHDRPVDEGTFTQTYVDARARWLYALAGTFPGLGRALADGDVSGWLTLGWFAHNPSYAARPDNSGLALLRYGAHAEVSTWHDRISVGVDATMFTDRGARPLRPAELDLTPDVIFRRAPWELHLAYERDLPLDRRGTEPGYTQSFAYALAAWTFDLGGEPGPLESRGTVPSP